VSPGSEFNGDPIDPRDFDSFSRRYFAAWNSHSPAEVAACATEDVVWESPALPHPGHGRSTVVEVVSSTVAAFPDYEFTQPADWAIAEDRLTAYLPWRMTGTNLGSFEPPGYAPTGRPVDLPGIDVLRFRDGLIWHYRSVYNYSVVARQLGLSFPRGGVIERVAVQAQRALVRLWLRPKQL
jgi:steroid delta-isomerase-like uncharacterized protein